MTLVQCPDCGKMVSTRVTACPECGCPAKFFRSGSESPVTSNLSEDSEVDSTEYKVFNFKECCVKYPVNSEKYANLYGDYLKQGFENFKQLCNYYTQLGNADLIATRFEVEVQKLIDEQINIILKDLYAKGSPMTMRQFKDKYSEVYLLDYKYYMSPFMDRYNEILGRQQKMSHDRAVAYANRSRWSGGGFGMKGAIKGAMQAGILNMGSSMISGMGNAVVASVEESLVDKNKQTLYRNEEVMQETCEGIITCMNGLFLAYTDELYTMGELESKINMDYEEARTKYEAVMSYETDKEKIFATVIECIGLYPAERKFYETIEMELEDCTAWNDFKAFWHLEFLYQKDEAAFLKTEAMKDYKAGTLKLLKDLLVFEGENPKDSKKIPIGSIKKVEKMSDYFNISIKGKFLLIVFHTPVDDIWVTALYNAMNGRYEKSDYNDKEIQKIIAERKENRQVRAVEAEKYILENYTLEKRSEAIKYYKEYVDVPYAEAGEVVAAMLKKKAPEVPLHRYPGTEELDRGLFRGATVVLFSGDEELGYLILTRNELIDIDVKKNKEIAYDVYSISHMKETVLGMGMSFRYPGKLIDRGLGTRGHNAAKFIKKIKDLQKGNFT